VKLFSETSDTRRRSIATTTHHADNRLNPHLRRLEYAQGKHTSNLREIPMSGQQRAFPFVQFDVFTSKPLEGNPLAVFPDARGLSDDEMQRLAREMNLAETTFVFPRDPQVERERGVRVRIFTVEEELPFAGHPTLGTAYLLYSRNPAQPEVALDLDVGKIPVRFRRDEQGLIFGEMTQRDPEFGRVHSREEVARAAGIELAEISEDVPVQTVSTGNPFIIVPLSSLRAAQRLRLDWNRALEYLARSDARFFYFVSRETVDPAARLHARMIFYGGEDPATGSAAGPCAAWMVRYGIIRPEERALIEQGLEIRRPSRIFVRAGKQGDKVVNVRVGGHTVEILRGEVRL
jgi:trans-2,3-dihydro-3-hydroxyanthranilate isomerase